MSKLTYSVGSGVYVPAFFAKYTIGGVNLDYIASMDDGCFDDYHVGDRALKLLIAKQIACDLEFDDGMVIVTFHNPDDAVLFKLEFE